MADEMNLRAQRREMVGKRAKQLRRQGIAPANISGAGQPSVAIQVEQHELETLLKRHGAPILNITVEPDGASATALLGRVERDAVSGAILHVDFRRVQLSQPIKAHVPVHTAGDAPAVKVYNGVLLRLLETVEIEALPRDLPEALMVDVSGLTELNTNLLVSDITPIRGVTVLTSAEEPVVTIKPPRVETPEETAVAAGEEQPLTSDEARDATSGDTGASASA